MRTSRKRLAVRAALSVLVLVATSTALADDPNSGPSGGPVAATSPARGGETGRGSLAPAPNGVAGRRSQTWIDATRFGGRIGSTTPQLVYASYHYYTSPGSPGNVEYFAPVELEAGVIVDQVTCVYNNSSATHNVNGSLQKHWTDFSTVSPTRGFTELASWSGTLDEGIAFRNAVLSAPETIEYMPTSTQFNTYHLEMVIAGDTSFAGCFVFWTRQVSPAPGSNSFTDVPTNYWAFQWIEALKASGVTVGCTPSTYCPEDPVTRAQMAVFLAKALGLHFPN